LNWNEYVEKSKTTALYFSKKELVACCYLGIWEELAEVTETEYLIDIGQNSEQDLISELGDVFWYLAILANHYTYDPSSPLTSEIFDLETHLGPLSKALKKSIREHDWELRDQGRRDTFCVSMDMLFNFLTDVCESYDFNLSDVLAYNIEKLGDRANRGVIHGDGDNR